MTLYPALEALSDLYKPIPPFGSVNIDEGRSNYHRVEWERNSDGASRSRQVRGKK